MPYTYLIKFKPENRFYYGVRFAKNCNPDEFWEKYFTSSSEVHRLIEEYGKESFEYQIRKVFDCPEKAIKWESKVLKKTKAAYKEKWINKTDSAAIPSLRGNNNPMRNKENREKWLMIVRSEEHRKKISESLKGHKKSNTEKYKKSKNEQHKNNMSKSAEKRERILCSKCEQGYTKQNFEKHYNSCKGIKQKQYKKDIDGIVRRLK